MKTLRVVCFWLGVCVFGMAGLGMSQGMEPNNSCQDAADLTANPLPISFFDSLNSTPQSPDIDFFRFATPPGRLVLFELSPDWSSETPLTGPTLGVFDGDCQLMAAFPAGSGTHLRLVMPQGTFVVGVTYWADWYWEGGGEGAYHLRVSEIPTLGSISGRIVNADTGEPVPYPYLELLHCELPETCQVVNSQYLPDGILYLDSNRWGEPLPAGIYKIFVSAFLFETGIFEPFQVAQGEHLNLGDLLLTPERLIASISGRAVDSLSGDPVPNSIFFSWVELIKCRIAGDGVEECQAVEYALPDEQGRFLFASPYLSVGRYRLRVSADQYEPTETTGYDVGENQAFDFGDVPLQPLDIQFRQLNPCSTIPAQGGVCRFSLEVRNGSAKRLKGAAWAQVSAYGIGSPWGYSQFQLGKAGTRNPQPQVFNLKSGQGQRMEFVFNVPSTVASSAYLCSSILAGKDPTPEMNTLGSRSLFCVYKSWEGFQLATGDKARQMMEKVARRGN